MIRTTCLTLALLAPAAFAQHPAPPPAGDAAPAPLPMEGRKSLEPSAPHGRGKPTPRKGVLPKPPVKPPTPETTAPDPVQ